MEDIKKLLTDKYYKNPAHNSVVLFVVLFLPILFVFAIGYTYIDNSLTRLTYSSFQQVASNSATRLERRITNLGEMSTSFVNNPKFRTDVNNKNWKEAGEIVDIYKKTSADDFVDAIFLSDEKGNIKSVSPEAPDIEGQNFAYRDWYQGVTSNGKTYISEVYKRANAPQKNVVAVATPIIADDHSISGILVFQISLDHFLSLMEKIPVGDGGFVYAVDQKGHIVASPEYLPQGEIVNFETNPAVKEAISGGMGITELYSPEKETYFLIAYQPVEHNWGILVQQPKDTAFSERNLVRKVVISIFFAVIIINIVRITVLKRIIKSCP